MGAGGRAVRVLFLLADLGSWVRVGRRARARCVRHLAYVAMDCSAPPWGAPDQVGPQWPGRGEQPQSGRRQHGQSKSRPGQCVIGPVGHVTARDSHAEWRPRGHRLVAVQPMGRGPDVVGYGFEALPGPPLGRGWKSRVFEASPSAVRGPNFIFGCMLAAGLPVVDFISCTLVTVAANFCFNAADEFG